MGLQDNSFERTILALSNELQRIRTEADWINDATSQDEYETYWIEFTALLIIG
ncbi:hypothetical protein RhiirA4_468590 [Rhizophagus irregularis]|uniref:Uncharacterized protein n=1 Tax=Rhizophagus irregularis TaxID=588596 RepID=A0A2I1GXZ8_9GLOM|nr:hypothetical protein RhiirA4_468590 [Rhizophagus irregularis]